MTDEELLKAIQKYEDRLDGVPALKGLPRTHAYSGDRENEEREVTRLVLTHLGYRVSSLKLEPLGKGTIPDVEATLRDGRHIGLEVTELVDTDLRRKRSERRHKERRLGLTPYDAFKLEMAGKNPTPSDAEDDSRLFVSIWTSNRLCMELGKVIAEKDEKVKLHRLNGGNFDRFSEMILAIFTGEEVTADLIVAVKNSDPILSKEFSRVFIVMDYDPRTQSYPVAEM